MEIYFHCMKGNQLGELSKHPRHIYPSPNDWLVCPVFALTLYLMRCFNTPLEGAGGQLFPGKTQYKRFSNSLKQCLKDHDQTVIRYPWDDYQLSFTGIPPYVAIPHEIRHASKVQKDMIDNLMKHLDGRLDGLVDLGNGGMSVARLTALFNESTKGLQEKIDRLTGVSHLGGADCSSTPNLAANNQLDAFILHHYGG
jgi:hypothetical protein